VKGQIGVARRVHLLDQYKPDFWASSACGKWAGLVRVVSDDASVTCRDCARLDSKVVQVRIWGATE
jgi:hypothetical protein